MFLGEYEHSVDDKGRLAIPSRFRDELGEGAIITRGFDHCVMGFPRARWDELAQHVSSMSLGQDSARNLRRLLFSGASDVGFDKQGRILLPPNLREYGGLKDQVVIAGLNTHFEIWSSERWQNVLNGLDVNGSEIAEQLASLGL